MALFFYCFRLMNLQHARVEMLDTTVTYRRKSYRMYGCNIFSFYYSFNKTKFCLKARAKLREADNELVSHLQAKLNEVGGLCLSESDIDKFLRYQNKNVILDALRRKHHSQVDYFKSKLDYVCFEKQSTNLSWGFEPQTMVPAVFGYDAHMRVYGGVAMFCSPKRNERIEPDPNSRSFVLSTIYIPGMLDPCNVWKYVQKNRMKNLIYKTNLLI